MHGNKLQNGQNASKCTTYSIRIHNQHTLFVTIGPSLQAEGCDIFRISKLKNSRRGSSLAYQQKRDGPHYVGTYLVWNK